MRRKREQKKRTTKKAVPAPQETVEVPQGGADTGATDNLLDEIDAVLEENALEVVQAYRQKGGE